MSNTTLCHDQFFGPVVGAQSCRGGFDFTLAFEDSLLSLAPSAAFLLCAALRAGFLLRHEDKARRRRAYVGKLTAACLLATLQIVLLALTASIKHLNTNFSIGAAILNVVSAFVVVFLSHVEHVKSIRPSFILTAYLFSTILFDATRARTEWLLDVNREYAGVLTAVIAVKGILLGFETVEKRHSLLDQEKKPSSESTSGPFSRGFFIWLNSLFWSGWSRRLTLHDLPKISEKLNSAMLAERFATKWEQAVKRHKKPRLFFVTVDTVKWHLLAIMPPRLAMVGLQISQPFLISHALKYLSSPPSEANSNLGYGLIGAFSLVFIGSAIVGAFYEHLTYRVGAMIRGQMITAIYAKMMKLPSARLGESSAIALMGNDVETMVEKLNMLLVESWANTLTVGLAMWMLYDQLGPVCVAPIIVAFFSLGFSTLVGKSIIKRLKSYQQATQMRINFTSQVVDSIKSVKMLGFVEKFTEMIKHKRRSDIKAGNHWRWLIVASNAVSNMNANQTPTITFGAFAIVAKLSGDQYFTAAKATVILSILGVMLEPLSLLLGNIPSAFSTFASFGRIQEFLSLEEFKDIRTGLPSEGGDHPSLHSQEKHGKDAPGISIQNSDFSWGANVVLKGINTTFRRDASGSLTMIIGPVGSGKTTLLKSLLGETGLSRGSVSLDNPYIAFCEQTPWLMNASIRDNIIGQSSFDEPWFDSVVKACDLGTDLARLQDGLDTVVGDKGLKLSGGQKQRMAIARAVYSRKKIAIFDDVFSGLDKITEQRVFERVFAKEGLLRKNGTMILMALHAVTRLPEADLIVALDSNGHIVQQGTFNELASSPGYVEELKIADTTTAEQDAELEHEVPDTEAEIKQVKEHARALEEAQAPPSDRSVFKYYFESCSAINLATVGLLCSACEVTRVIRYVWLTWWGDGKGHERGDLGYWLGLLAMLGIIEDACIVSAIAFFLMVIGPRVGFRLHERLLNSVVGAPMSFLSKTDGGSILNRFSQDLRLIDIDLNTALAIFLFEFASCIGTASLAIAAVGWFAIAMPFVIVTVLMVQRFYVRTSKQLRLLEIEHKAPLYSHFLESINGLTTIRAFGWVPQYKEKNIRLLDDAQKPSYLMSCIQRWLTLVLDMVVAFLTIMLVTLAVELKGKLPPSLLGIALVNMMMMGRNLKAIIVSWSTLETSLGAIARIKHFAETTPVEALPSENQMPDRSWPSSGSLKVRNLEVAYNSNDEPVLRDVSISILPGQRVGLCGRSGSGKSSTLQALLRMVEITKGQILVDGADISTIPRSETRKRMSCLTQDPFLFNDTLRFNMDPMQAHSDEEIRSALRRVGLWDLICEKFEKGKELDEQMDETVLSHGQRQLFCLARALLKPSPFLILDEPTSNVDSQTDARMQEVIRTEFTGRTIIMVAHRLNTLMDFDKIAVMDSGALMEFGSPAELLAKGGLFTKLYRADTRKASPGR